MAIQRFKLAVNSARFPLISTKASRSVYIPGLDSAPRTPRQFVGAEQATDYNVPQAIYMENVMPVAEGLRSVRFDSVIPATAVADFGTIFPLRDEKENIVLMSPAAGRNYVYEATTGLWKTESVEDIFDLTLDPASEHVPEISKVTYAYVDGKTFVCYSRLKSDDDDDMSIMMWDSVTLKLEPALHLLRNVPFATGTIDGISSSNGYLLIWSGLSVAWASFDGSFFDYAPYANGAFTGSGNQIPEDVQGPITAIVSVSGGFLIFTTRNCVGASYHAQNTAAPWLFREVSGSGGVLSYEVLTVEGSLPAIYAYTTSGLQKISLNSAENLHPQVADFLTGRMIERYDAATKKLTQASTGSDLACKLTNIGNRYLVISYGPLSGFFEYALVWDLVLDRWGKMKVDHTDCFHYTYLPEASGVTYASLEATPYEDLDAVTYAQLLGNGVATTVPAQHSMGFLTSAGAVLVANWADDARTVADDAVVILGRIQLSRSRNTQINRVELDGAEVATVGLYPSYNGRTVEDYMPLTVVESAPGYLCAGTLADMKNFDLHIDGAFNLSSIIIEAMPTSQL